MVRDQITASVLLIAIRGMPYLLMALVLWGAWDLEQPILGLVAFFAGFVAGGWNARNRGDPEIPSLVAGLREIWG